ncbi:Crp/Fnr family transcriptional regulator [Spiribacter vilamensis]|uniref:CRP/FNR family transcriptional regulator n=1 Tax=Spiribacter vilamensis TaxID=531306 RepID=A0A4Q8CYK4_9GAMM|nr:helix-turn-helix domain-containing protein [Spiribacter vilamensis]RZU98044.1 CRP/FNR family transcriptional regulator [Spiribacter vilamensis]TVO61051.1 cyclic nucleotide-binding domain-containing protein [Spiribacter vilamensis]
MENNAESSPCLALDAASPAVLGEPVVERLRHVATQHPPVAPGTRIYTDRTPFSAIFAVRFGAVKTVEFDDNGDEQVLSFHLPGEFFGLTAIHAERYVNTAIALQRTAVCSLSYQGLSRVADESPPLRRQLMRLMSGVILTEQGAYAAMAGHAAPARLAFLLLSLRLRMGGGRPLADTIRLPMSRAELGSSIGLTPETTSRMFTYLRREGLIEASGRNVRFVDPDRLQAMADPIAALNSPDQVPQNVAGTTSSAEGGERSHGEASGS